MLFYEKHWEDRTDLFHGESDLQQEVIGLQFVIQEAHYNLFSLMLLLHLTEACASDPIRIPLKPTVLSFLYSSWARGHKLSFFISYFYLLSFPFFLPSFFSSFPFFSLPIHLFTYFLCYLKQSIEHQNSARHTKLWWHKNIKGMTHALQLIILSGNRGK